MFNVRSLFIDAQFRREGGTRPEGRNKWFWDVNLSGGAMLDLHIHDVDMIRMDVWRSHGSERGSSRLRRGRWI